MADLARIDALLVPVQIEMQGIKIKFKVSPTAYSDEEFLRAANQLSKEITEREGRDYLKEDHSDFRFCLAHVVKEWDLTDEGQPAPITDTTLQRLPNPLLREMWNATQEALLPKNLTRRTLPSGSPRKG